MPDALCKTVSATEAPALLDASPYTTRFMLYQRFARGAGIDSRPDNRMDWGRRLEPLILEAAAEELHLEVVPNRDGANEQVYERRGVLGCTRDATVICPDRGPGAMDSKCVFDYGVWMRDWNGGKTMPRHIEIQLQVQMFVGDGEKPFSWGTVPAWLAGELHFFERKPIPALWERLEAEAGKFLADVAAKREPDPFGSPVEVALLTELFPTQVGDPLLLEEPTKENLAVAEKVRLLEWHTKERGGHAKAEKAIKAELLGLAKAHDEIRLPYGIRAKIKQQSRGAYSVEPPTFKIVDTFVPANLPEGNLGDE